MACKKSWCSQCSQNDKPGSKIKERLKKKIANRKSLEKCVQNDFACGNATNVNSVLVDFENIQEAQLFIKQLVNKKPQLQIKEIASPTESEKRNNEKKTVVPKKRNKKDSKIEKTKQQESSIEIQKIVDFIEGKDRDAKLSKKRKNLEKRARRREKKFMAKEVKEQPEIIAEPEQPKESEPFVQESDVKNVTVNHNSKEESINLTLSLTGSSVLVEKIIANVIQVVPDFKKSLISATGTIAKHQNIIYPEKENKPDIVDETDEKQKKNNRKRRLRQRKYGPSPNKLDTINNLTNDEMNKASQSENATFFQRADGMVIIKRPEINVTKIERYNYNIQEANKIKTKNCTFTNKPLNKNIENVGSNKCNIEMYDDDLDHILHGLPEITITRKEKINNS